MNKSKVDKENLNTLNLPSGRRYTNVETREKNWKPSIKVGYQEPAKIDISVKDIRIKKEPVFDAEPKPSRKKRIETARSNFEIKDSLYSDVKESNDRKVVRGNTRDVYTKHYKSSLFLKDQPVCESSYSSRQ